MTISSVKKLATTNDILPFIRSLATKQQEHFVVLSLNSEKGLIRKRTVFIGTVNSIIIHPREIFSGAMKDAATGIVIIHNHPTGDPTPSGEDIATTKQLMAAGLVLGIPVYDHIIMAKRGFFSFNLSADKTHRHFVSTPVFST